MDLKRENGLPPYIIISVTLPPGGENKLQDDGIAADHHAGAVEMGNGCMPGNVEPDTSWSIWRIKYSIVVLALGKPKREVV